MKLQKCLLFASLYLLLISKAFSQGVIINEFASSNSSILQDSHGEFPDWIELYNSSNQAINLSNYAISDDLNELRKWIFPDLSIDAHSFLIVFASGNDDTSELHTNFKISQTGEALYLTNSNESIVSSMPAIYIPTDKSYGNITDASNHAGILNSPSPGSSNVTSNGIYASHPSGFYNTNIQLTLTSSNSSHKIYYTLNGETPTSNSLLYTTPITFTNISDSPHTYSSIPTTPLEGPYQLDDFIWYEPNKVYKSNIIRFASFDNGELQSDVFSRTYFIDPEIENRYTFPIVSLITDSLNLFDYERGIYIPGKRFDEIGFNWWPEGNYHNRGAEWERELHLSFFQPNGILAFETNAGMRMRGYGSASAPQKSFGLYFRSEYGISTLNYPVFDTSNTNKYKRLIFRNSGNDVLHTHFRDALLQNILKSTSLELQNFQASILFLNGEYWGIHNIREKYDKYYFKHHYNISENDINILGICGSEEEGSNTSYINLLNYLIAHDLSIEENYKSVANQIDIENFIDFQIAEIYFANYDWPCNNYKIWKSNSPESKWRFLIYDLDLSFGFDKNSTSETNSLEHATSLDNEWPHCECSNILFRSLLKNESFKQEFIERFTYHLNNTFDVDSILNLINDYENLFKPEIQEHIDRWNYPTTLENWTEEIAVLRNFAKERPCYISKHLKQFFQLNELDFECPINTMPSNFTSTIPNPNNGEFSLMNVTRDNISQVDITIINLLGELVYSQQNLNLNSMESFNIDISTVPNGMYLLSLKNNTLSETQKIIINR